MRPSEGYVTTEDGVRLFFQRLGSAPQMVLFPNGICLLDDFQRFAGGRTIIFYDVRNRGRSDHVGDASKLARGIHQDVDDLEAVRRHFGIDRVDVIGHSYVGLIVALYAMRYAAHVDCVIQIGPPAPDAAKQYPAHLTGADATLAEVLSRLAQMQKKRQGEDPQEFCRKFWSVLRVIYVVNPADADKVRWDRCDLPNEFSLMKYWSQNILPSIQSLHITAEEFAQAKALVLIVHGVKDRSSPYGGGRDWALKLPNARLVTVENAAHAPWVESPERVFSSIETFLGAAWPEAAEKVTSLDPEESAKR